MGIFEDEAGLDIQDEAGLDIQDEARSEGWNYKINKLTNILSINNILLSNIKSINGIK